MWSLILYIVIWDICIIQQTNIFQDHAWVKEPESNSKLRHSKVKIFIIYRSLLKIIKRLTEMDEVK